MATVVALGGALLTSATEAHAQHAQGARPTDELTTLEKNLAEEHASLSTSDCATACRALASIRRAADKICALDPDERCAAARAKAEDATRRVRDACPDCAIASAPPLRPQDRPAGPAAKGGAAPAPPADVAVSASEPRAESRRGGCAGCTTTGAPPFGDLAGGALAIATLALLLRRRRARTLRRGE